MLIPTPINPSPNQGPRIMRAYKAKKGCRIRVRKAGPKSAYKSSLLLTREQSKKYHAAKNGSVVSLPFLHKHLRANMKHRGGFLPLLLAAMAPVLGGVLGGVAEKAIAGSGIYKKRKRGGKKRRGKRKGSGMYLNPWMGPRGY